MIMMSAPNQRFRAEILKENNRNALIVIVLLEDAFVAFLKKAGCILAINPANKTFYAKLSWT